MFGFGKKKFNVESLVELLMDSMFSSEAIDAESNHLTSELSQYSDLAIDKKKSIKKYWLLLKSQLIFGAIAKSTDIIKYEKAKSLLKEEIELKYDLKFAEETVTEFSPFNRYILSYAKSDVHDAISSLQVDFLLNLGISELTQNSMHTGEVGMILHRKISHHYMGSHKAIIDSIKIV